MAETSQSTPETSSAKSQAAMTAKASKTWYNHLNPWYKEDTRPEWERKRDEKFKQWEKDNSTYGSTTKYMTQFYKPEYKKDGKTQKNKGAWGYWLDIFA